jgi:two-component system, response regulator YesN
MPFSILIAEDEAIEREALQLFIERTFGADLHLETAENGIELEEKVASLKPDIVIADIEMPGLNGLEALVRCRTEGYRPRIIIQTAYSQFDYAREAINLEVDAYLLKPIKREEIAARISVILHELEEERKTELLRRREMRLIKNSGPVIEQDIIASLQMGHSPGEMFLLYTSYRKMSGSYYYVISFDLGPIKGSGHDLLRHREKEKMIDSIRQQSSRQKRVIAGVTGSNRFALIASTEETSSYRRTIASLEEVKDIIDQLEINYSCTLFAGIGLAVQSQEKLPSSFRQSLQALEAVRIQIRVIHFGDLESGHHKAPADEKVSGTLITAIRSGDRETVEVETARLFEADNTDNPENLSAVKDRILQVLLYLWDTCTRGLPGGPFLREQLPSMMNQLEMAGSSKDLRHWFAGRVKDLCFTVEEQHKASLHICVKKAMEYIQKNYMKDLSLDLVAEEIGVSPYHLSHLFKQELDTSYISYLTETRIQAAERLIREQCHTIQEISSKVGYRSASYLSKVFLKKRGSSLKDVAGICVCCSSTGGLEEPF